MAMSLPPAGSCDHDEPASVHLPEGHRQDKGAGVPGTVPCSEHREEAESSGHCHQNARTSGKNFIAFAPKQQLCSKMLFINLCLTRELGPNYAYKYNSSIVELRFQLSSEKNLCPNME